MPDLAHDVRLGISALHTAAELAPELVVVDLLRHIQPPTIAAKIDPVLGHIPDEFTHGGRMRVEFGQCRQIPPRLITDRIETTFALIERAFRNRIGIRAEVPPATQPFGIEVKPIDDTATTRRFPACDEIARSRGWRD